jgi:two-component system nitrogen regulation sensor histidine kinase NtrY
MEPAVRWTWWAIAAGAALLSASQWLHAPSVEYLIPLVVATVAALVAAIRVHGAQRWWAVACSAFLVGASSLATPAQRGLWRVRHDWDGWRRSSSISGVQALQVSLDDALRSLDRMANAALEAPPDRSAAFERLSGLVTGRDERGVVLYHGRDPLAWAGTIRPPVDTVHDGVSIVATPFYLALQIARRDRGMRSVSVALIDAAPPADRLSTPLTKRVEAGLGLGGFVFTPPVDSSNNPEVLHYSVSGQRLFDARAFPLAQGEIEARITEIARARAGLAFALALMCFVIGVWRGTRDLTRRWGALALGLSCTALVPLSQYSNLTRLFDPSVYFTANGGPLTGNAGALATTAALVLLGVLAVFRRKARRVSLVGGVVTILLVAGLGPFLLRELARGIQIPAHGVDGWLWLIWEIPLFLAAVSVLLAGAAGGAATLGARRGMSPWVAPAFATLAAVLAPIVWEVPGRFPWWYTLLWVVAIGLLALSRRTRFIILSASAVAALGATTLVWARTARGRVDAAVRDIETLSQTDSVGISLLQRLGLRLRTDDAPNTREALLKHFVTSDIANAGYPTTMFAWPTDSGPVAQLQTADMPIPMGAVADLVAQARSNDVALFAAVPTDAAMEVVMAAPSADGGVTAVLLAPRSRLFDIDPFAQLYGLEIDPDVEPPYTVRLRGRLPVEAATNRVIWRREGTELHGDIVARTGTAAAMAHLEVELRSTSALVQRGALIVLLDLAIVGVLWLASVLADGGLGRWFRVRRRTWGRSFRVQVSLALFAFFVIPAVAFAIWSYQRLATDATRARGLLIGETLRSLAPPPQTPLWLPSESNRLDTPLLLYRGGLLRETSDPLYNDLAPIGRYLGQEVELNLAVRDEETVTRLERVGESTALFGFRAFNDMANPEAVVGAPARPDELTLGRRRRDLGVLVLFATGLGALAALWLSGFVSRQLASPIGTLREAALALAAGGRTLPLEGETTVEFTPVFSAFRRMVADLSASRSALEEAQRRTAAVLRNVASGVVAVDADGRVALANPRAESLLGGSLASGVSFAGHASPRVVEVVERFLKSNVDDEAFELSLDQMQVRGALTRLAGGGAVVTLDDVTELARAQRVLAWGEMARQVAHEIKNPLTPIRLGVQHLRRARADARVDFDRVLDQNVNQILAEIDRLDEIARAFSRYGAAPEERRRAAAVDVAAIVREVVSLERMGAESTLDWIEQGVDAPVMGYARTDELKEVLLNVLENARHAQAKRVSVSVSPRPGANGSPRVDILVHDDGTGIAPDILPRIFEPHFSTSTSGSGLGLAISRQLVEGWGGEISVESVAGEGATVLISLRGAD